MRPLLSPAEMAAADAATIAAGLPGFTLMERAGGAVARAAIELAGRRYGTRVAVVCGKGNNGGDGFVAARRLHRQGVAVRCLLLAAADDYRGDAAAHLERMTAAGVKPAFFERAALAGCDVVVDAIFGTGFKGRAEGPSADAITAINDSPARVVAVDIPSGVAGASGAVDGPAVRADVTVAMAAEKFGTAMSSGLDLAGAVRVADIGIAIEPSSTLVLEAEDVRSVLPVRARDAHKRSAGSVVVLAGSDGMSGAALLTARGAARTGAGYVTLITTPYVDHAKKTVIPEAVSRVAADRTEIGPEVLEEFASDIERADAVAVGPGLGQGDRQRALVEMVLSEVGAPLVLDADALNVLADDTKPLAARDGATIITPHPGEMASLLGIAGREVQTDRLGASGRAAEEFGCTVVLKGAGTVVATPGEATIVNSTGGSELATAGTGDVLTGVVAALLSQRLPPHAAAWASVYVHGLAGTRAGRAASGSGVVAWDVAEALPPALAEVRR